MLMLLLASISAPALTLSHIMKIKHFRNNSNKKNISGFNHIFLK